jgi:hypothetical protein
MKKISRNKKYLTIIKTMRFCYIMFLILFTFKANSQDKILKPSGEIIQARIQKISKDEVWYKLFE